MNEKQTSDTPLTAEQIEQWLGAAEGKMNVSACTRPDHEQQKALYRIALAALQPSLAAQQGRAEAFKDAMHSYLDAATVEKARADKVTTALRNLLKQVDDFCSKEGEADFYTGEAVEALGGFAGNTPPSPVAALVERTRERGYAEVPHENIPTTYRPSVAVSGGAPKSPYDFEIGGPPTTAGPQPIDLGDVRPFLKDGESVSDCIARNRRDTSIVLGELAKEKFKSERLERELADMIQQRDFYAAKANGTPLSATGAEMPAEVIKQQAACLHPVTQVFFRAGLLACREYMARFVEAQDAGIAASIRANWWPSLGKDFGAPRLHDWAELTAGEYGTPEFRCKGADEVSPTQEALAIAYQFLTQDDTAPMAAMDGGAKP